MSTEKRGSEKLMSTCTDATTLSQEELEKVAGAALATSMYVGSSYNYWKIFPHGQPWPELFEQITVQKFDQQRFGKEIAGISNGF